MASVKGIEVSGEIYDLEDSPARESATEVKQSVSALSETVQEQGESLTEVSGSVAEVSADTQEVSQKVGNLSELQTTEKTNLVGAINEVASGGFYSKCFVRDYSQGESDDITPSTICIMAGVDVSKLKAFSQCVFEILAADGNALRIVFTKQSDNSFSHFYSAMAYAWNIAYYEEYTQYTISAKEQYASADKFCRASVRI